MRNLKLILVLCYFLNICQVMAQEQSLTYKITKNLRCLVCQGQSVYDSQSDFALSMKILIQNKIDEGKNDEQIYEYLKAKYGEWIVYDPEVNIALGAFYLNKLLKRFQDLRLALEAYNHGPTQLKQFLKRGIRPKKYSNKVYKNYNMIKARSI